MGCLEAACDGDDLIAHGTQIQGADSQRPCMKCSHLLSGLYPIQWHLRGLLEKTMQTRGVTLACNCQNTIMSGFQARSWVLTKRGA